tara:strand:- start:2207 stop:2386 length:180 start_codon:yes stop_codon:yes gene_type:complete
VGKTIAELYPDGYSIEWRKHEMKHYIEKCKEHEEKRLSTNERMEYWEVWAKKREIGYED